MTINVTQKEANFLEDNRHLPIHAIPYKGSGLTPPAIKYALEHGYTVVNRPEAPHSGAIPITFEQLQAAVFLLNECDGNPVTAIAHHRDKLKNGGWYILSRRTSEPDVELLNDITPATLAAGFERGWFVQPLDTKPKLVVLTEKEDGAELNYPQIAAIEGWFRNNQPVNPSRLMLEHVTRNPMWENNMTPLNGLASATLAKALYYGVKQ